VIRYEHPGADQIWYNNEAHNLRTELDELLRKPAQARKAGAKPPKKG